MTVYRPHEFAELIGKSTSTLRRWDREGRLVAKRGKGNQRYYTDRDLQNALGLNSQERKAEVVTYCRVSTHVQKDDLTRQQERVDAFCIGRGLTIDQRITDFGSGMNFKRKNFLKLMKDVRMGRVSTIVVAYKDRLCGFGFDFIEEFCSWYGCSIILVNDEKSSPEQELVEDLLAIIHSFSSRLSSLRRNKKKLKELISL